MKKTISEWDFINEFNDSSRKNQFSRDALEWLYQYYTETEEATGEEIELDIVAICCEWTEYEPGELVNGYGYKLDDIDEDELNDMDEDEKADQIVEILENETTIANLCGTFLVMNF